METMHKMYELFLTNIEWFSSAIFVASLSIVISLILGRAKTSGLTTNQTRGNISLRVNNKNINFLNKSDDQVLKEMIKTREAINSLTSNTVEKEPKKK